MRVQVATVLTNLGNPGPKGEVLAALARMIGGQTQPKMSLEARGQVAALLKQMKYEGTTVDGKVMSRRAAAIGAGRRRRRGKRGPVVRRYFLGAG